MHACMHVLGWRGQISQIFTATTQKVKCDTAHPKINQISVTEADARVCQKYGLLQTKNA